jgi:simple sugar transport system permease protein
MDLISLLQYSAPVALAAMGEVVTERGGLINIGLEGTMLVASFFSMLACYATHSPWLGLGAGIAAALVTTVVFGVFAIYLCADQVVVGTAVNLLALGVTGTLFRSKFGQSGQLLSVPRIGAYHGVDPLMVFMLLSAPLLWVLLRKTAWGLAVRACGEYPKALDAAGFSVRKVRMQSLLVGGVYAGLAGGYLALVITGSFAENMTAGRGFVAIAMVTFGRWKPQFAFLAALLIGYAESLQYKFQTYGWKIPYQLMIALPYVVALLVLVIVGKGGAAPGALAQPYRKER